MSSRPCMIHGYEQIVLRTIAGPFRGYRCVDCGHVTDVDPRKATHHVVYPLGQNRAVKTNE